MRLDPTASQAELLVALTREAEVTWGAERLSELKPMMDVVVAALWELSRRPLEVEAEEPDFIGGAG